MASCISSPGSSPPPVSLLFPVSPSSVSSSSSVLLLLFQPVSSSSSSPVSSSSSSLSIVSSLLLSPALAALPLSTSGITVGVGVGVIVGVGVRMSSPVKGIIPSVVVSSPGFGVISLDGSGIIVGPSGSSSPSVPFPSPVLPSSFFLSLSSFSSSFLFSPPVLLSSVPPPFAPLFLLSSKSGPSSAPSVGVGVTVSSGSSVGVGVSITVSITFSILLKDFLFASLLFPVFSSSWVFVSL